MRIGVFGGAFNPPHLGHLVCASEAHGQLELDEVLFVPAARPPHRPIDPEPGAEVRFALCELAVEDDERFSVSRAEIDRDGLSYTADTLASLGGELFLILGADQAAALPEWHEPERVLELATVAVAAREGMEEEAVMRRIEALPGHERTRFFDMPRIDISSTRVRSRVAASEPIRYLVPDAVADRIEADGLYR